MTRVAVIDFGKTNVKVALVAREGLREIALHRMPNEVRHNGPFPHYDTAAHWDFLLGALTELQRSHGIDAISVTTHGATAALVDGAGALVLPILDYEDPMPAALGAEYDALRPDFARTGSPRLGAGLNLGAQLFRLCRSHPAEWSRVRHILTYPQYWAFRLTGVAAVEPTSLGCHTDLWLPQEHRFSSLVGRMGWLPLMPPLRGADEVLGPVLPELAARTGLAPGTPVTCGIHDSNASLYPHLLSRAAPFAVVSTGTWVVAMAVGGGQPLLDPARDTLVNTGADGRPIPSARFMGGREYELVRAGRDVTVTEADRAAVLRRGLHLLPSVAPGSGPFPGRRAEWTAEPATEGERALALSWYLAGMTDACLAMIGAAGPVVAEGPFARNPDYLEMLGSLTGRVILPATGGVTGTSTGAALLVAGPPPATEDRPAPAPRPALLPHGQRWRDLVRQAQPA